MSDSNSKEVFNLASYASSSVQANDLLFITDYENRETKKINALDLAVYTLNQGTYFTGSYSGSLTGSLFGTASWALNALTSAYSLYNSGTLISASNIGPSGVGIVYDINGSELRLKKLNAGTNVALTDNISSGIVTIDVANASTQPGGPESSVQFNNPLGTFNGSENFTWDDINKKMYVSKSILCTSFTASHTNTVGFLGTASYAVSASSALSSSYSYSGSYALSSSNAVTASYVNSAPGLICSMHSASYITKDTGTGTTYFDTGLSITITPRSATSKFFINASIVLSNGDSPGNAVASLYKDSTALIEPFTSINSTIWDAVPSSITYIDHAGNTSPRTYVIKVKGNDSSAVWYTNRSQGDAATYYAYSYMTILEII